MRYEMKCPECGKEDAVIPALDYIVSFARPYFRCLRCRRIFLGGGKLE